MVGLKQEGRFLALHLTAWSVRSLAPASCSRWALAFGFLWQPLYWT